MIRRSMSTVTSRPTNLKRLGVDAARLQQTVITYIIVDMILTVSRRLIQINCCVHSFVSNSNLIVCSRSLFVVQTYNASA